MSFRYRKSVRLMPGLRLILSKRGASVSVGRHGLSENFSRRGLRTTVGAPGTGWSYSWRNRPGQAKRGGSLLGGVVVLVLVLVAIGVLFGS